MSKAEFELAYDGDALADHDMDVDDLAPALLAVGELCREANRVLNGDRANVSVRVRADFERKCFDIHFELVQTVYEQIKGLLADDRIATAKNILEWLGLLGVPAGMGLLTFRKMQKGRPIESATRIESRDGSASYQIVFHGDGNSVTVPAPVYALARDVKVQKAERGVARPLREPGVDALEVRERGAVVNKISRKEASYLGAGSDDDADDDLPETPPFQAILELRAAVFVRGEKWRFNYGDASIAADMRDKAFLNRVFVYGERFGAGDKLQVSMRVQQYQTESGQIRNRYEVLEVLRVWSASEQLALPLMPGSE